MSYNFNPVYILDLPAELPKDVLEEHESLKQEYSGIGAEEQKIDDVLEAVSATPLDDPSADFGLVVGRLRKINVPLRHKRIAFLKRLIGFEYQRAAPALRQLHTKYAESVEPMKAEIDKRFESIGLRNPANELPENWANGCFQVGWSNRHPDVIKMRALAEQAHDFWERVQSSARDHEALLREELNEIAQARAKALAQV